MSTTRNWCVWSALSIWDSNFPWHNELRKGCLLRGPFLCCQRARRDLQRNQRAICFYVSCEKKAYSTPRSLTRSATAFCCGRLLPMIDIQPTGRKVSNPKPLLILLYMARPMRRPHTMESMIFSISPFWLVATSLGLTT